jgi:hypothetical protein
MKFHMKKVYKLFVFGIILKVLKLYFSINYNWSSNNLKRKNWARAVEGA